MSAAVLPMLPARLLEQGGNRATLCLSPESELPKLAHNCITYRDGVTVDVAWTKYRFGEVCWMLLNGNDYKFFLSVYQDSQGTAKFAKNKLARADKRGEWAWNTITGKAKTPTGIGFYPTNVNGESRWGALDFDAHGEIEKLEAHDRAHAAFDILARHSQHRLLLGTSGGGGWHLFVFANGFYKVEEWIRFLEEVALRICSPIKKGVCEIFPSSTRGHHGGGGIRAPGTFNPKNGEFGRLFLDSVTPALNDQPLALLQPFCQFREGFMSSLCHATPQHKNGQLHDKGTETAISDIFELSAKFAIRSAGTRSEQLKKLIGETFRCYGQKLIRQVASLQYEAATPKPNALIEEHLANFENLWTFFCDLWRDELTPRERTLLDRLVTTNERDVFRVIHGWAKLASDNGATDYPVSCEQLASRIGITWQGISKMRSKFASPSLGIIRMTAKHKANVSSARYQWIASPPAGASEPARQKTNGRDKDHGGARSRDARKGQAQPA
jgi:hypothetical protein